MWATLGILCFIALAAGGCFLVHASWVEKQRAHDDALIRAVNGYGLTWPEKIHPPRAQHACDDDGMLLAGAVVVALAASEDAADFPQAPMPAVFRSRGAKPFMHGGNAHQRAIARRWLVTQ